MNPRLINPFIVGNSVGNTPAFVGREDILLRIVMSLRQPAETGLLLFGQRRIGKSSLLHQLHAQLPRLGPWHPVFFDLHGRVTMTVDLIVVDLAAAIARTLDLPAPALGAAPAVNFRDAWLPEVLRAMPVGHRLVLLFDEFDVLSEPGEESRTHGLFPYLGEVLGGEAGGRVASVYAIGRTMDDLDRSARALMRGVRTIHVSTLERGEFELLLDLGERDGTMVWGEGARDAIWGLTGGHPLLTQLVGSSAWEASQRSGVATVTRETVGELVPMVLKESRSMLSWLWDGLTPACRVVAAALAAHDPPAVNAEELATVLRDSGVRMIVSQLAAAPLLLRDWDLLDEVDGRFQFRVELLRMWIQRYQKFETVRECLDELVPAANVFFREALSKWQGAAKLDPAELTSTSVLLESILNDPRKNPNHVGAALLLSDVYRRQGRRDDAIRLLERLLPIQPTAIGPHYVQLLLQRAAELEGEYTEDERLDLYEKSLQAAPRTTEAVAGRAAIWRARGDRARGAGRLKEALDCYHKADDGERAGEVAEELARRHAEEALAAIRELEQQGRFVDALDRLTESRPAIVDLVDVQALHERLSRRRSAEETYQAALAALDRQERDAAIERLCQALQLDRGHAGAARELAWLLQAGAAPRDAAGYRWLVPLAALGWILTASAVILLVWPRAAKPEPGLDIVKESPPDLPGPEPDPEPPVEPGIAPWKLELAAAEPPVSPESPERELPIEAPTPGPSPTGQKLMPSPLAPEVLQFSVPDLRNCGRGRRLSCYSVGLHFLELGRRSRRLVDLATPFLLFSCEDEATGADACCRLAEVYDGLGYVRDAALMRHYRRLAGQRGYVNCLSTASGSDGDGGVPPIP